VSWSWDVFWKYLLDPGFLAAAWTTVWVAVVAQLIGIGVGLVVALAGLSRRASLRNLAGFYLWIWRGTPLLVQLLVLYLGLPQLGIKLTVIQAGLLGLGLNAGAFMAEIVRAGILSVDRGQLEAARSLGLSSAQAMRLVILPQAARVIVPPLGNEFNSMLRTTSLLSVISFEELLRRTTLAIADTFRPVELYSVAALYYLAMTSAWTIVQAAIERHLSAGAAGRSGRGRPGAGLTGWLFLRSRSRPVAASERATGAVGSAS
jgi:polar amino acid transport system permease protein